MSDCVDTDKLSEHDMKQICMYVQAGQGPKCFKDSCNCQFLNDMCNPGNCKVPENCAKGLRDAPPSGFNALTYFQKVLLVLIVLIILFLLGILIKV